MSLTWESFVPQAIEELYNVGPESIIFDYGWVDNGDGPSITFWNEDKFGPLDMDQIQERAEEIMNRKIVPKEISKAQALQALDDAGLYDSVVATISNHDVRRVKIWFDSANYWERYHPYIQMFGPEFDLTEDQIDDLFIAASKL